MVSLYFVLECRAKQSEQGQNKQFGPPIRPQVVIKIELGGNPGYNPRSLAAKPRFASWGIYPIPVPQKDVGLQYPEACGDGEALGKAK
jgi:hypothetical protein